MRGAALLFAVVLTVACATIGRLVAWACTSGVEEVGSLEGDLCEWVGELWSVRWWITVLWPAALFAASQFFPVLKGHAVVVGTSIGLLAGTFWLVVSLIVIDVG